jgi:hypothetical protein
LAQSRGVRLLIGEVGAAKGTDGVTSIRAAVDTMFDLSHGRRGAKPL